jgi:hypothetical protein
MSGVVRPMSAMGPNPSRKGVVPIEPVLRANIRSSAGTRAVLSATACWSLWPVDKVSSYMIALRRSQLFFVAQLNLGSPAT